MKNSTELIRFIARIAAAIISSLKDGKVRLNDLPNFIPILPLIRPAFEDLPDAWDEFRKMSELDREALSFVLVDELKLSYEDPNTKDLVNDAIDAALSLVRFVVKLKRVN
jgi:hypothetical protein